ncbi:hypothetical protein [Phenylobacterium sp.]|jgi:hypothetical protein|uniref:hypothetical protein n=1 Tax=Phenylobacterium sp. TaxID=1871053 RepID=UPI002E30776F|nr:hypothetical protein [Phenylobacterium sp.]HEX4708839.1 hypothetical protein [Phenylobacterium sp.]
MTDFAVPAPDLSRQGKRGAKPAGRIRLGSEDHLRLLCLELLETHDPYKPAVIDWPKLDDVTRNRIVSLPIWDIAVQTEGRAGLNVKTFGATLAAGLLKEAVDMNAFEESRHKVVLANMVSFYGIQLEPEPEYKTPRDPEWAFMVTGYSECIDSFFGFGLFDLAKQSGFFPAELVDTFEPVMREEGRHILFFVNWVAWWRRNMPWWRRPWFELKVLAVWTFLIWERIAIAGQMESSEKAQDNNFTLNGSKELGVEISFGGLARICLAENDRRLAPYDARLIRPRFVPNMIRLALRFMNTPPSAARA